MYTDWYKLNKLPFRLRPDPEFLYLADDTAHVLTALRVGVASGHGIISLVGIAGVGKTTLLHMIAEERQGLMTVVRLQLPNLSARELVSALAAQFGLPAHTGATQETATRLVRYIAEEASHRRKVLILVDEAHRASSSMLRALLNLSSQEPAPLIVLAGEPGLDKTLAALETQGARLNRIGELRLPPLHVDQIEGYLTHRLRVAGSTARAIFDAETHSEIWRYTGGVPQLINVLCDSAMTLGANRTTQRIGNTEIRDAVQELQWVEYYARAAAPQPAREGGATGTSQTLLAQVIPELEVHQSGRFLSRMVLKPGRVIVGRADDAGVRLDSVFVSRHHCQLITTAEQTFVEDSGSTNGLLVNGKRRRLHRLQPDDKIVIGDYILTYLETPDLGTPDLGVTGLAAAEPTVPALD